MLKYIQGESDNAIFEVFQYEFPLGTIKNSQPNSGQKLLVFDVAYLFSKYLIWTNFEKRKI